MDSTSQTEERIVRKVAQRLAGQLAATFRQRDTVTMRRATVTAIHLDEGILTADLDMAGTTLHGVPMTIDCAAVENGDRVMVETYAHQSIVTGVLARSSDKYEFVRSVQWKPPYGETSIRLYRVGNMVCATGLVKFMASGEINDSKHNEIVPAGYRPAVDDATIVSGARSTLCFSVKKNGTVYGRGNSNGAYTSLTGSWGTLDPLPI
ncbi:hypothetical protein [Bifidobacterium samirii]|uniref:Uncharacterized protein n=1 Tax=Bifidobacterium samirii TaxID=2306974 RepID=A0A430FJH2_9BIFI|nr:hypothetical protein [Bifidobacterium samirii]RSX53034.1 hypothetical protein D2E24_1705 [Bifidobacterium samirii]